MVVLGGLTFEIVPEGRLSEAEREVVAGLHPRGAPPSSTLATSARPFVIELVEGLVAPTPGPGVPEHVVDDAPAAVSWAGDRVRVRHRRVEAELDPFAGRGWLRRDTSVGWPVEVTLRTALAARLPLEGGLPLHAAGVVVTGGRGVAFHGPSGAGKSTLAAEAPYPVLSDEMVALVPSGSNGYVLTATGTWGTHGRGEAPAGVFPLAGVCALDKGTGTRIDRLAALAALRGLIPSTLVPPGPPLWSAALGVIGRVARDVPAYRLTWHPAHSPWAALERALRD